MTSDNLVIFAIVAALVALITVLMIVHFAVSEAVTASKRWFQRRRTRISATQNAMHGARRPTASARGDMPAGGPRIPRPRQSLHH